MHERYNLNLNLCLFLVALFLCSVLWNMIFIYNTVPLFRQRLLKNNSDETTEILPRRNFCALNSDASSPRYQ